MKNKKKGMFVKLNIDHPVSVANVLCQAIEDYSSLKLIKQLYVCCHMDSTLVMSLMEVPLLSKKEVERRLDNTAAACILSYAIKHWDELLPKSREEMDAKINKFEMVRR